MVVLFDLSFVFVWCSLGVVLKRPQTEYSATDYASECKCLPRNVHQKHLHNLRLHTKHLYVYVYIYMYIYMCVYIE